MKAQNLREKTLEELRELYEETRSELFDFNLKSATGDGADQPLRKRTLRREVARINTVIRELEGVK